MGVTTHAALKSNAERDVVVANDVNSSVENVVDDNVLLPVTAGGFRFNGGNGNLCL